MKKYIVSSICTLVLSLIGALGANKNALDFNKDLNANTNTTVVEETVTDNKEALKVTTAADEDKTEATRSDEALDNKVTKNIEEKNISKDTVAATDQSKVAGKEIATTKAVAATKNATKKNTVKKNTSTQKAATPAKKTTNTSKKTSVAKNNTTAQTNNTKNTQAKTNTTTTKSNNTYVYKNVNLADCTNTSEVIAKLQQNGFNINSSSVKNNEELQAIINQLQSSKPGNTSTTGNNGNHGTTTTPTQTPSKAPTPTSKPTTQTPATQTPSSNSSFADQVLTLVNQERAKAGLSALKTNSTITAAANKRAQETVQSFSHTRPNGTSFSTVLKEYGVSYRTAGENIAYGQKTPQEVVTAWMNSPGHRANILNGNFGTIGIGVYQSGNTYYWSQLFTN